MMLVFNRAVLSNIVSVFTLILFALYPSASEPLGTTLIPSDCLPSTISPRVVLLIVVCVFRLNFCESCDPMPTVRLFSYTLPVIKFTTPPIELGPTSAPLGFLIISIPVTVPIKLLPKSCSPLVVLASPIGNPFIVTSV